MNSEGHGREEAGGGEMRVELSEAKSNQDGGDRLEGAPRRAVCCQILRLWPCRDVQLHGDGLDR